MAYDVVIIGAGPAGLSLGVYLQKRGISTCILEKRMLPRDKLCAGLLTRKARDLVDEIYEKGYWERSVAHRADRVTLALRDETVSSFAVETPFMIVERKEFDASLLAYYQSIGGTVLETKNLYEIDYEHNKIVYQGEAISYRVLVGADGVYSRVRKHVAPDYRVDTFYLEGFVPLEKLPQKFREGITLTFGLVSNGYAWVFPRGKDAALGYGPFTKGNIQTDAYSKWLAASSMEPFPMKGHHIVYGNPVKKPQEGNILLIGEAAGLVDPITGEGLYYAFYSAKLAGECIAEHLASSQPLTSYVAKTQSTRRKIRQNTLCQHLLYQRVILEKGLTRAKGREGFFRFVCEHAISQETYTYLGCLFKYFGQKVRR